MRQIYSLLLYILTPVALVYFLVRGLADRAWWSRWSERFGNVEKSGFESGIVIHAVSVGEVNAALPLVRAIEERWPDVPLTVTCFTPTGSARIRSALGPRVHHTYVPFDLPGASRKALRSLRPRLLIVMETEIWPNLFAQARQLGCPIVLANARLTERSYRRYSKFRKVTGEALRHVNVIAAQSDDDRQRYIDLGAQAEAVSVLGNLKFDLDLPEDLAQTGLELRAQWGSERAVIVGGSTHEEDERALLGAFSNLRKTFPDALLIIAPRYPERFGQAAELAESAGLAVSQLSGAEGDLSAFQCLIVDTLGKLLQFYAAADVVFIGGTISPVGGHNPLEAAALGRAVILGPNTQHITALKSLLLASGAAISVENALGLSETLGQLISDRDRLQRMGEAGRQLVQSERGALTRTLEVLEKLLLQ